MTDHADRAFDLSGALAPPMTNGELVFDAPWQGRVFGMARSLAERGVYSWDELRERLIAAIESADAGPPTAGRYRYYDHFLRALEALLVARGLLSPGELESRVRAFADRPHGHDHSH